MRKVFLSSTSRDLADYRAAVTAAIHGLGGDYHCIQMEDFGARDSQAADFCAAQVRRCHLFVGLLGHCYGSCPPEGGQSYTEREYDVAVEIDLPRLIFVAADDLPLPTSLREPDDKWQRQQQFRQRVSSQRILKIFRSPQELAAQVIQAIRNWEREQPPPAPPDWASPPRAARERGPWLGADVHRMCDRTEQETDFVRFFSAQLQRRAGWPQLFLIPAPEDEYPESLVKRFQITSIRGYARHQWGEQRGVVGDKFVEWPQGDDLDEREQRLRVRLFGQFAPAHKLPDEFSAAVFKRVLTEEPEAALLPAIVVQHHIRAAQWRARERLLLERYLRFWDELGAQAPLQQFLVFLLIIYPTRPSAGFWQKLFNSPDAEKKRVAGDLQAIATARQQLLTQANAPQLCPTLLLEELPCVRPEHVNDWFSQHHIYDDDEDIRWQKRQEIFQTSDCRPMKEVEGKLKAIVKEFISQKGRL